MPPRRDKTPEPTSVMSIRLPDQWIAMLNRAADRKGITRNALLKRMIARSVLRISKEEAKG